MPPLDDRYKAMLWQRPDYIPVGASILPAAWIKHRDRLDAIVRRHPLICSSPDQPRNFDQLWSPTYAAGDHVDAWGCVWSNIHTGREAIVTGHPLPTRAHVRAAAIPEKDDRLPHGFMYLRLADLRGFDEIMLDFAEEPPELQLLLDKVLAYNLRQVQQRVAALKEPGTIQYFGDDLGMQTSLPISPEKWRKYLKPCFAALYQPVRRAGHYVYMHTDGHILEIIPDLIDCGANVVNPQVRANGLPGLRDVCFGKVCVNLDLDRQLMPFCSPADLDEHIRQAVETLGSPEGGLWLTAEIGDDVPLDNVEAILTALEKYRGYFRQ